MWIREFGAPAHFSTMTWEPKHKELKLIKEKQTNNTDHGRDIAQRSVRKSIMELYAEKLFEEKVTDYCIMKKIKKLNNELLVGI